MLTFFRFSHSQLLMTWWKLSSLHGKDWVSEFVEDCNAPGHAPMALELDMAILSQGG